MVFENLHIKINFRPLSSGMLSNFVWLYIILASLLWFTLFIIVFKIGSNNLKLTVKEQALVIYWKILYIEIFAVSIWKNWHSPKRMFRWNSFSRSRSSIGKSNKSLVQCIRTLAMELYWWAEFPKLLWYRNLFISIT